MDVNISYYKLSSYEYKKNLVLSVLSLFDLLSLLMISSMSSSELLSRHFICSARQSPHANIVSHSSTGEEWVVGNFGWNGDIHEGDYVSIDILGEVDGDAPKGTAFIEGQHGDPGSTGTVTFGTAPVTAPSIPGVTGALPSGLPGGIPSSNCEDLVNVTDIGTARSCHKWHWTDNQRYIEN